MPRSYSSKTGFRQRSSGWWIARVVDRLRCGSPPEPERKTTKMVTLPNNAALNKVQNDEQLQLIDTLLTSTIHMRMLASHYTKRTKAVAGMGCIATTSSICASVFSTPPIHLATITIIASLTATIASDVLHRRSIFEGKFEDRKTDNRIRQKLNQRMLQPSRNVRLCAK